MHVSLFQGDVTVTRSVTYQSVCFSILIVVTVLIGTCFAFR